MKLNNLEKCKSRLTVTFQNCHFIFDSWMDLFIKQTLKGANFNHKQQFQFQAFGQDKDYDENRGMMDGSDGKAEDSELKL